MTVTATWKGASVQTQVTVMPAAKPTSLTLLPATTTGASGSVTGKVTIATAASFDQSMAVSTVDCTSSGLRTGAAMEVVAVDDIRQTLLDGRINLPRVGAIRPASTVSLPFVVVDGDGEEVEPFSVFLRELMLTDMSPLTARSYGNDLLRWWRLLQVLDVAWDRATRSEVEVLVGWMRSADNPQRHRRQPATAPAGSVNRRTGKRSLRHGYAPATINHTLSVLSSLYAFHAQFERGPVINPLPSSPSRRARLAHRSPIEAQAEYRRAPLRQKPPVLVPRSIPDRLVDELFAALRTHRDRALLALYLSTGARASELLGVCGAQVDWARQQVWVVSKGTRALQPVPASPEALVHLAFVFRRARHARPGRADLAHAS